VWEEGSTTDNDTILQTNTRAGWTKQTDQRMDKQTDRDMQIADQQTN